MRTRSVATIAAVTLLVSGCSAGSAAPSAGGGDAPLRIVATTTQLTDVTRSLVGDAAEVTGLLQPGQSAHAFDPGPAALSALGEADLLVINGAGLEGWLDATIESSGFDGTLVDTSANIELLPGDEHEHEHEGETAEEHAEHEHEGETAEEHAEHEHEHDHGEFDPHVWTDPVNMIVQAETVRAAVETAAPDLDIAASADETLAQLRALDDWMRASFDRVPEADRRIVTTHDTFGYLAREYGIEVVGTVLPSIDDHADASAAHIDELVAQIRETGTHVVFSENAIDPQLAATIAREAGVELRQGDDALSADALGPEGSDTATYVDAQIHNTTEIVTSWGAEPAPLPEALS